MNGVHDLGGMHGFGPVEREAGPPTLEPWEAAMIAIQSDTMRAGLYNIDEFRHAIERMEPVHYLASSYFEHWLDGITRVLIERGAVAASELDARTAAYADGQESPPHAIGARLPEARIGGGTVRREVTAPPRFRAGDRVRTETWALPGHTRLARYARGKHGTIRVRHGAYVFPDANAHGLGEQPHHLYSVGFPAAELWGESAEPGTSVFIDLWEPYLLPA
ncbi:MAG: nitrile hydratase subunit beta [Dehalococcoidia bacterium]